MFKLNKILNEDCLEGMKRIPQNSVDMILCDLPYGTTNCKWDSIIPFEPMWEQYERVIKENGAIILFASQPFTTRLIWSNIRLYRYNWYWKKNAPTGFAFARYQPMRIIEDICVFYKKAPTYNPQGLIEIKNPKVKKRKSNGRDDNIYNTDTLLQPYIPKFKNYPKHLLEFDKDSSNNRLHPTQKPVALLENLIKTYTNEKEIVLDNCMGSGSTAIACLNTNRNFIGFELEEMYYEVANNRLKKHSHSNVAFSYV